jgi:aspartyl-tRNA(Asn)/glutamyl-tRNA(Gln) amidotransferase subunit C
MENILGYVETLNELDTEGVEPTYQVTDLQNIWRDDEIQANVVGRDQLLSLAKKQRDNQIEVPKVL